MEADQTVYELVGGESFFVALVDRFYEGVARDPLLRPMYPEEDLTGARERLTLFLIQYWGGPTTYSDQRGHPALRMRHFPYAVTAEARDAWLTHMNAAVRALAPPAEIEQALTDYFAMAAHHMINTPEIRRGP